jgi:hypothetical protein
MLGASAIRIIEQTPGRLVILEPPYTVGYVLAVGGILWLLVAWFFLSGPRARAIAYIALLGPGILLALAGFATATWTRAVTFSRPDNQILTQTRVFGINLAASARPLSDAAYADVVQVDVTRNILLHLHSGSAVPLFTNSDRHGQHEAAQAINQFLLNPAPSKAEPASASPSTKL